MPCLPHEVMKVCPCNPSHLVPETGFQVHLVRCGRGHLDKDMVVSSWNSAHVLPKSEVDEHERNCPDSVKFLRFSVGSSSVDTRSSFCGSNANSARWEVENQTEGHEEGRELQEEEEDLEKEAVVEPLKLQKRDIPFVENEQVRDYLMNL